jgi:hypothetical protein
VKILFDECMPQPLRRRLAEFEISTAQEMGWGRVKNGELLKRAEGVFDILLTADQELKYQQNLKGRQLAILVLSTNRWPKVQGKTPETSRPFSHCVRGTIWNWPCSFSSPRNPFSTASGCIDATCDLTWSESRNWPVAIICAI